jgi:PAS domain S-box-containing protein
MREGSLAFPLTGMEIDGLLEVAPVGLALIDRDLRFVRVNALLAGMTGLPLDAHAGRTVREVVPDLAEQFEGAMRKVLAGERLAGVAIAGETPARPGVLRSWRTTWTSLREPDGRAVGAALAIEEVGEEKAALRRRDYLLRLEERLRAAGGADAALDAACALLGREIGATFVGLSRVEEDGVHGVVENEWRAGATPSLLRRRRLADFGEGRLGPLLRGETVVVEDATRDPRVPDPSGYLSNASRASVDVPLLREGRLRALLFAADERARRWTADEVALVEETAARAWETAERARAESALRTSEARFRQMAEAVREVFYVVELDDGRLSYVSPAYEAIWGRPVAALLADPDSFAATVHPDDRGAVEDRKARLRRGETVEGRYRIVRPDGAVRDIRDRVVIAADPLTGLRRGIGLATDVTDQRAVEERLQLATGAAGMGIFDVNLVTGAISWDARLRAMWGVAPDEAVTDAVFVEGVHPADRALMREAVARALDPDGGGAYRAEYRVIGRGDGTERWIAAAGQAHFLGPRAVRLVGTVRDITARKRAEAALTESEARFRTLADTLPALIFVAGAEGNLWVNDRFAAYTGLPRDNLLGDGWRNVLHPDDVAQAEAQRRRSSTEGAAFSAERRYRRADGAWRWHLVRSNSVPGPPGAAMQWVGAAVDIQELVEAREALAASSLAVERANAELESRVAERTASLAEANARLAAEIREREAAQAQLVQAQKLEALGSLTSGIAHDFNNIIAAIAGGFQVVERRAQDSRLVEVARHGARAAERGGLLVKQLLAFARQQVLAPRAVDLAALVAEAEPLLSRSLGPGVALGIECPPDLSPVRVDPVQLETALINLAVNARDAMEGTGRATLSIRPSPGDEPGRPLEMEGRPAVALTFADEGCGMPPELLDRVLEPFFTTKEPGRGTGLGLAMVHGFARQSGGALRIQSRVGEGTRVTLWLPLAEGPDRPGAADEGLSVMRPPPGTLVLLVDDDAAVRGVTAAQLQDLGCRVIEAADADEALARLRSDPAIDVLLTDVAMPDRDGAKLAAEARAFRPGLPILFMTGHADRHPLAGETVLDKPFTYEALGRALGGALGPG